MSAMVKIEIRPSRQLALVLVLAHLGAAAASIAVELPAWAKAVLLIPILASLAWSLYKHALLGSAHSVVAVEVGEGSAASVRTRSGDWHKSVVLDSSFVAPYLTVLNLRIDQSRFACHVVIMPDSVMAEDFRRLRVWLRWRKTAVV